jgi:endonuclease/exonuclease/phosphatase (EEP) superfamily protein YafD
MFSNYPFDETVRVRWPTCVESSSDCLALKGFSMTRMHLTDDVSVDVYDLHMEAGGTAEDDASRAIGLQLLSDFIAEHSESEAVIVGGDFNLHTDREPAASQLAGLLEATGLTDACTDQGCDRVGSLDKFLFRSSDRLDIHVDGLSFETDVFVSPDGDPLSDHDPLAVHFEWSALAP